VFLTPIEEERLLLFLAAELARRRLAKGLKLNHPEAIALICDELHEAAREGRAYDDVRDLGYRILTEDDVLPGVSALVDRIQVEPLFEEGSLLVTLHHPIRSMGQELSPVCGVRHPPGEILANVGRATGRVTVTNRLDRAVQVRSHYHFFEVNRGLDFDRAAAYGMHLDIPAGTAVRFESGETKSVDLVAFGGARRVIGFQGLVNDFLDAPGVREKALAAARRRGFISEGA
jgi:urease subunit gamma/beta